MWSRNRHGAEPHAVLYNEGKIHLTNHGNDSYRCPTPRQSRRTSQHALIKCSITNRGRHTLKAGLRFMKLVKVALREVVSESNMSWQCTGVRYSSTSTAVAWNMLRKPLTPEGIKASEIASTWSDAYRLALARLQTSIHTFVLRRESCGGWTQDCCPRRCWHHHALTLSH